MFLYSDVSVRHTIQGGVVAILGSPWRGGGRAGVVSLRVVLSTQREKPELAISPDPNSVVPPALASVRSNYLVFPAFFLSQLFELRCLIFLRIHRFCRDSDLNDILFADRRAKWELRVDYSFDACSVFRVGFWLGHVVYWRGRGIKVSDF